MAKRSMNVYGLIGAILIGLLLIAVLGVAGIIYAAVR